jgi:hypothetical protein
MIEQKFTIYNFLAKKLDCKIYDSINDFETDLKNNLIDKRCIAFLHHNIFDIDKKEIICQIFTARGDYEWFKLVGNVVTEYYRRTLKNNWFGISYHLDTNEPLEYYKFEGTTIYKFNYYTNEKTGCTNNGGWDNLPKHFQEKLDKEEYFNKIYLWAEKPYGNIIGVLP